MRANTSPSRWVTSTQTSSPAAIRSRPDPVEPCSSRWSPSRAQANGSTSGRPSRTTPTWASSASSRTSSSASRSVTWRWPPGGCGWRRRRGSVGGHAPSSVTHPPAHPAGWAGEPTPAKWPDLDRADRRDRRPGGAPHPAAAADGRPPGGQRLRPRDRRRADLHRRRLGDRVLAHPARRRAWPPSAPASATSPASSSPTPTATTTPRRPRSAASSAGPPSSSASATRRPSTSSTAAPSTTTRPCRGCALAGAADTAAAWREDVRGQRPRPRRCGCRRTAGSTASRRSSSATGSSPRCRRPGHTAGHFVFADLDAGLLFAGDHVLPTITPSVGFELVYADDPLRDFLGSLERVRRLPDLRLLPAHGAGHRQLARPRRRAPRPPRRAPRALPARGRRRREHGVRRRAAAVVDPTRAGPRRPRRLQRRDGRDGDDGPPRPARGRRRPHPQRDRRRRDVRPSLSAVGAARAAPSSRSGACASAAAEFLPLDLTRGSLDGTVHDGQPGGDVIEWDSASPRARRAG